MEEDDGAICYHDDDENEDDSFINSADVSDNGSYLDFEEYDLDLGDFYLMDEEEMDLITYKDEFNINKRRNLLQLCADNFIFGESLPLAASEGNLQKVESYIRDGIDINFRNEFGNTALHLACYYKHNEIVHLLLNQGADMTVKGNLLQFGQNSLHAAALSGDIDTVKLLHDKDVTLNDQDDFGNTALHLVSRKGHLDAAKFLVDNGADTNLLNKHGHSPLHIAIYHNHRNITEILINVCPIDTIDVVGNTILHFCKDETILSLLLAKSVHINVQNNKGTTPLLRAISHHQFGKAKVLIQHGADVNISDFDNTAPLHKAAVSPDLETVELLIANGACLEVKDDDGITPFQYAAIESNIEMMQLLWKHGADVNAQSEVGYTALYHLCWNLAIEGSEPLEEILKLGCDLNISDCAGVTPLHVAILMSPPKCVKILIDAGADTNMADSFGRTSLMYSTEQPETTELILKSGVKTDLRDKGQFTVLHHSIINGRSELVKNLLNLNPQLLNMTDRNKATPLHLSASEGSTEILNNILSTITDLNINVLDKYSCSSLHYSVWGDNPKVASVLIEHGSHITQTDSMGETPFQYGIRMGRFSVCGNLAFRQEEKCINENAVSNLENIFTKALKNSDCESRKYTDLGYNVIPVNMVKDMISHSEKQSSKLNSKYLNNVLNSPGIGSVKNAEAHQIQEAVHNIIKQISDKLKIYNPMFENYLVFTGSSAENTKVSYPDEFDVMFVLHHFSNLCVPGDRVNQIFTPLIAKNPENIPQGMKMFFGNGVLQRKKLFQCFHKLLYRIITSKDFHWPENIFPDLWGCGYTNEYQVNIMHNFMWRGREYKKLQISVDMVPAIFIPEWPSDVIESPLITMEIKDLGFHVVAKQLGKDKDTEYYPGTFSTNENLWRISFTTAEQKILKNQNEVDLNVYRILKALRHKEICPGLQISLPQYKRDATFPPSGVIPSYFIKMTFLNALHSTNACSKMNEQASNKNHENQFNEVLLQETFQHLEKYFKDGILPFFFLPEYNIMDSKVFESLKAVNIPLIMCKMLKMITEDTS